jgi:hypothetical protein
MVQFRKRAVPASRGPIKILKVTEVPAQKAKGKPQPAAPVVSVTTASQAHGLRSALGLRNDPEQDRALAQRMTTQTRQRAIGRPVDVPTAAAPTFVDRPRPSTTEYVLGDRLPQEVQLSTTYMAIVEAFIRADRMPITLSPAELAKATGLSVNEVAAAIIELEKRKLLTRQPNRAFSTPMWAPASI